MTASLDDRPMTSPHHYAKLCDLADFEDPELLAAIHSVLPERDPREHVERKVWEFGMFALFLSEQGVLDDRSEVLAVGAGDERMAFWLANRVGMVTATDIYGEGEFAHREAGDSMLSNPGAHAPFPYREDRLRVLSMDGRALEFSDESFDVVYSLSSIEHFGGPRDVARAAREMGRVLRPGGVAFVVTECLVRRHSLNAAPVDFAVRLAALNRRRRLATPWRRGIVAEAFTPRELERRIVGPSGLELMQPVDLRLSERSWENLTVTHDPDSRLESRTGEYYPHILLQYSRSVFTSVCLPLRKPAA
jgi:SAM-dependent methyltransferase